MLLRERDRYLVVHTPSKLNLFLEILGRRTDGYHELETVMVSVGLYDSLRFREEPSREIRLRVLHSGTPGAKEATAVPDGGSNLVVRAAELLRDSTGVDRGVRIDLCKRIPAAAGLAGGSSDAAATLVALSRFWNVNLTPAELHRLAAQVGSDVPFFLAPSAAAICRGRGENVEPLRLPLAMHFVMACPSSGLSTADVFRHCRPAIHPRRVGSLVDSLRDGRLRQAAGLLHNALQPPAEALNAEVTSLKCVFSNLPVLGHMMSGSGTAYFGICGTRRQARTVAARLRALRLARVWVVPSRP